MTWTQLSQQVSSIPPADRGAMEAARRRWDAIAKPLQGLGRLEDLLVRMAGVTGSPDLDMDRKAVAVFCADNGVVAEGVTQTGQEVTWTVAQTMGERRSSVCHMARTAGAQVFPVDLGMVRRDTPPGVRPCVVLEGGTRNMTKGPAMPREAAERALAVGFSLARELAEDGDTLLAAGEMGIGNTTTTAAVACALLGLSPQEAVGRGAGLSDAGLARKRRAVERALEVNRPDPGDPVDILCKVGGLQCGKSAPAQPLALGALRTGPAGRPGAGARAAWQLSPGGGHRGGGPHASAGYGPVRLSGYVHLRGNGHRGLPARRGAGPRQSWAGGYSVTALVFGGAASGKSEYGEELACKLPRTGELIYLATMEPFGPEAEARIRRHRELRAGRGFSTLERARDLAGCPLPAGGAVLLEDLGNLAANELFSGTDMDPEGAFLRIRDGLQAVRDRSEHLVVISNDLHRDGETYPRETECYLDLMARLHRELAVWADQVVEVVCGLPVIWKGERA